jgi:hypothetical protein
VIAMALPPKPLHPLTEIAARWQVDALVIVGWAIEQRLVLTTALPLIVAGDGRWAGGLVEIAGEDVFALFGADAVAAASIPIDRDQGGIFPKLLLGT